VDNKNIIFVMLDTVRADMLSTYGGKISMPNLDRLARHGRRYDMAVAPGTYTLPSHLSIFLGKRVTDIPGMKATGMKFSELMTDPLLRKARYASGGMTLAGMMEYFGYRSAMFSNNPFVSGPTGLADGFSHVSSMFVDSMLRSNRLWVRTVLGIIQSDLARRNLIKLGYGISSLMPDRSIDRLYLKLRKKLNEHFSREYGYYRLDKGAVQTNRQIKEYANDSIDQRNFIFINYMEGHEGYPTNLVARQYVEQDKWLHMTGNANGGIDEIKLGYARRLEYLDSKVGDLLGTLGKAGILDDAAVIIASDHGQAFMEHGQMFHNTFPYNEVARVPLVIAQFEDGRQVRLGETVNEPFSLTRLNGLIAAGMDRCSTQAAISDHIGITEVWDTYLLKLFRKRSRNADMIYSKKRELDRKVTAIYKGSYKVLHHYGKGMDELYDLKRDPAEEHNIIGTNRGVAHSILRLGIPWN
jgi:arylsulfatase A-like enzyme